MGVSRTAESILDNHSKIWLNPPNREVSNRRDLPAGVELSKCRTTETVLCTQQNPTVIHHHYPLGINPNLLHANPVLAKMLAPSFVPEAFFPPNKAIIITTPVVNLMSPVFAPIPTHKQILPNANKVNYCSTPIANILEELRKDPMRKVSPPNKVVLPNVETTQSSTRTITNTTVECSSNLAEPTQNVTPFSLQYCTNNEYILRNIDTPFLLRPITLSRKFNSFHV